MGKATAAMALNPFSSSTHRYIHNNNIVITAKSLFNLRLGRNHSSHFNNSAAAKTLPSPSPPPTTTRKTALSVKSSSSSGASADENPFLTQQNQDDSKKNIWEKWRANSAEMSGKLAKLGLSAVLAYGLFDAVTYTSFFVLAFLGYERSTGNNPAANLQALLGIVILMWTGNNVTRPFRVAGAAALAPAIDKGLRKIQEHFKLPSLVYAFAVVVGIVAAACLTVIGILVLSRWGK